MERAASKELENTPSVIKKTGFFERVDKLYGDGTGPQQPTEEGTVVVKTLVEAEASAEVFTTTSTFRRCNVGLPCC